MVPIAMEIVFTEMCVKTVIGVLLRSDLKFINFKWLAIVDAQC